MCRLPPWMFDLAAKHSLRLMVATLWPSHLMFLEPAATAREIRATVAKLAAEMRQFRDVIFAYSLGNEIRPDLIRWYGMRARQPLPGGALRYRQEPRP